MNYKLLISTIAVAVFAIIFASLWTGIATREVTVVDHPYDEGLKYDATQKKYADLGWKVVTPSSLKNTERLNVNVLDKNGAPLADVAVEFAANRITSPDIRKYHAVQTERGRYEAKVDFSSQGLWELKVNVTRGNDTLSYESKLHID